MLNRMTEARWTSTAPSPTGGDAPGRAHRSTCELEDYLPQLQAAPRDRGRLELVVARPGPGRRAVLSMGQLDERRGLVGDDWSTRGTSGGPGGGPHPRKQLNVMSYRMASFLAVDPDRIPLAGDQLYLDLDLSVDNLPVGTRLVFGSGSGTGGATIEVTEEPHLGCASFLDRFGEDGMRFVNGRIGRSLRLRGLAAVVDVPGQVRPGDTVVVRRPA